MLANTLSTTLASLIDSDVNRFVVALSGGLDSSVLLHALCASQPDRPVTAIHIHHGLQSDADRFATHAQALCEALNVALTSVHVDVDRDSALGPEGAAREARYRTFEDLLLPGDCLLSAHHRGDQAETLLLHLLRGSGPRGLSGVPDSRPLGKGTIVRPLLNVPRQELLDYARTNGVDWAEDPSNSSEQYDRNFLRHSIVPALEERFPNVEQRLSRAAGLQREVQALLDELAEMDLEQVGGDPSRLVIPALAELSAERQRNLLRHCLRRLHLGEPGFARTNAILDDILPAREDATPLVSWPGGEARRYRSVLHLMQPLPELSPPPPISGPDASIALDNNGRLRLVASSGTGIDAELLEWPLRVAYRAGGERFRPAGDDHERSLKSLLQTAGVLPWLRDRIPLIYSGDRLVAVGGLWIRDDLTEANGLVPEWQGGPRLF